MSCLPLSVSFSQIYSQEASDPHPYEPDPASEPFRYVFPHIRRRSSHRTAIEPPWRLQPTPTYLPTSRMEQHQCFRPQTIRRCSSFRLSPTDTTLQTFGMGYGCTTHAESHLQRHSRSGRWRSEYEVNIGSRSLQGKIAVDVHYYEQGNVGYITPFDLFLPLTRQIHLRSN